MSIVFVVGISTILIPILTANYWWFIIPAVILIYGCILSYWLFVIELPKHKEKPYPQYDDAWFEGQATSWGLKYVATDKIQEVYMAEYKLRYKGQKIDELLQKTKEYIR